QAAVAQVVLNRVRNPIYPRTVCGVVYQGAGAGACQFSFACDGAADRPREAAAWRRARDVAHRALSGYVMSAVGRATSFHVATLRVAWGGRRVRIAQVGQHVFFGVGGHRQATVAPQPSAPSEVLAVATPAEAPAQPAAAVVPASTASDAAPPAAASAATP